MRILSALFLFALWLVLSASNDVAHVVAGAAVALLVVWLNPTRERRGSGASWLSGLAYLPWLTVRIIKSALHVSRLILSPSLPISPRFVRHQTELKSDGELVVLGNSITLTPGTITVEVEPGELLVHAIDEASSTDLTEGVFDARVSGIFATQDDKQ
jgi:multicomponent Na+:H+ antiporter subunit E